MPTIPLHPPSASTQEAGTPQAVNPLPGLLQTPSGLAILELQGTIHTPALTVEPSEAPAAVVGRLEFPHYNPALKGPEDTTWMKRVYLYAGKHQRLTGEVKKLPKAIAVIRKRQTPNKNGDDVEMQDSDVTGEALDDELEIVEIVKYKILFSSRPEPVSAD